MTEDIQAMEFDINKVIEAAEAGGQEIKKHFGSMLDTETKKMPSDIRTIADLDSEKAILSLLEKNFPDVNIYSEEQGEIDKQSELTFIVDPLDGSNNFVTGIPYFSATIGLMHKEKIILGVTHNPITGQTFHAMKGQGAYENDKKIEVSNNNEFMHAGVVYTCGYENDENFALRLESELIKRKVKRIFNMWSPALDFCNLAAGKIEVIINNENDLYDFVAGKIIAAEAGAKITDFSSRTCPDRDTQFVVSNGTKLHEETLEILKQAQ